MQVERLALDGLLLIRPRVHTDARGFFFESYNAARYREHGVDIPFVQDNHSLSVQHTLRGLHCQVRPGQAKLVRVTRGAVFDVAVDIRPSSETFGRWVGVTLDAEEHTQLYIPAGFLHGFCVTSDAAEVQYKVSTPYDPATEAAVRWDDADLGITWPTRTPLLSERDRAAESFAALRGRLGQ